MPAELLDVGILQTFNPLLAVIEGFVRIGDRRKQESIPNFPVFFQFFQRDVYIGTGIEIG